jgi:hypothetical protein
MLSVRALLVMSAVLAAVACGDGRRSSGAPPSGIGPDAVLIRVPAEGGLARAHRVGKDSVLWTARAATPALVATIGFDDFLGLVLAQDSTGNIVAIDLRLGGVQPLGTARLRGGLVSEGAAVFGLDSAGRILRLTPSATWNWPSPRGENLLVPNADGALLVLTSSDVETQVRRLIPPEQGTLDSAVVPRVRLAARTLAGDRLWLATDDGLLALRTRDLQEMLRLSIGDSMVALAPTPSGDRVFIATDDNELRVVDRYAEAQRGSVDLPEPATALRMDPDGHYLLARASGVDSVYVISIGTNRVVNTLATPWRADLPLVTPDGRVLMVAGNDVVHVDAETGREQLRYRGGAGDLWALVRWNGFRPRAAGLDRPVEFEEYVADSAATDSAVAALIASRYGDLGSIGRAEPMTPAPTTQGQSEPPSKLETQDRGTWTVSFATLLTEERARTMADSINVESKKARVVPGNRDGVPVWRVLLGPFDSRQAAERAGMESQLSYWVFEGMP